MNTQSLKLRNGAIPIFVVKYCCLQLKPIYHDIEFIEFWNSKSNYWYSIFSAIVEKMIIVLKINKSNVNIAYVYFYYSTK